MFLATNHNFTIQAGDFRRVGAKLVDIAAVITSPPYNAGKEYETELSWPEWGKLLDDLGALCAKVIAPGGYLCLNVPMWMFSRPRHFVRCAAKAIVEAHIPFVDWITWVKGPLESPERDTTG